MRHLEIDYYIDACWEDFMSKHSYEQCEIIGNIVGWPKIAMVLRDHFSEQITNHYLCLDKGDFDDRV